MRPIHRMVARRWRLERLAWHAGAGAVGASLLAWASGASAWWHLAAIVVGAAVAAAWPTRIDERRALRWVGAKAGLAYETSWDHPVADEGGPGDLGASLRAAVAVQGRLSVRDLRPPATTSWWLPLLTVAFGMWAWSAWVGPDAALGPFGTAPAPIPPGMAAPAAPDPEAPEPDEDEAAEVPSNETAEASGAQEPGAAGGSPGPAGSGNGGAPSERDALERFLENLRERPQWTEEERLAAQAELAEGTPQDADPDSAAIDDGLVRRDLEEDRLSDLRRDGPADAEPWDGADPEPGEGAGAEPSEFDEEAAQPDPEDAGPQEDAADPSGAPDASEGAGEGPGLEEGGDEGMAGVGVGTPAEAGEPAPVAAGEVEPLPSVLGPGPEHAVGGIQMPGAPPEDGVFPAGAAGVAFQRAVEEALTEGDLPATYLEVIRNYFR